MSLLSGLTKAFTSYGDDILRQTVNNYGDDIMKNALKGAVQNKIDDVAASNSFWNMIGNATDNGVNGAQIRNSLKNTAMSAIDDNADDAAKAVMSNMPVVGRASGNVDDLLSGRVGSYYQMTPANNIMTYGDDAMNYTTLIDPDSALTKATDKYTKLISPGDTGLPSANGYNIQDWSDILNREVGGGLGGTQITDRNILQDYVYRNQGRNFQMGEPSYAELALPTDIARQNLQIHVPTEITDHTNDILNNTNRGNAVVNSALDKIKNSKNRSKAFDQIFLTGAPILGGGAILASLLGNSGQDNNNPI